MKAENRTKMIFHPTVLYSKHTSWQINTNNKWNAK